MKMNFRAEIFLLIVTILFPVFASRADAQTMNDYCVVPPFITNPVAPNVLLVLDESGSMQFPAYLGCTFGGYSSKRAKCGTIDGQTSPQYNYDAGRDYYGLFKTDKYYLYSGAKFEENDLCSYSDNIGGPDCIPGNLLNWSTMSRIDLLRKALIGGKSVAQQGTVHTLRGEGGLWTFSDPDLYCTFNVSGGVFPDLDHKLTISNYEPPGACTPDSLYSDNFDNGTLDSKWTAEDIGTGIAGSQSEAGGILSVQADGTTMWGSSDEFRYIHQTLSGDFDVRLRIITPPTETGQTYAKAGLMVRADNSAGSRHVKAMATNLSGLQFSSRTSDGGSTDILGSYVTISYPVWVRLVRTGDTFTAFYSSDGQSWTQHSSTTVSMPAAVLVGMAASSYSSVSLGTAEYDEFIYCVSNPCKLGTLSAAEIKVDLPDKERRGVIQKMADVDYDGIFDEGAPRFGLMVYAQYKKGCMRVGIKGETMAKLVDAVQTEAPYAGTPTGPALDEARDYCSQSNDNSNCGNSSFIGSSKGSILDPWYDDGTPVPCRETFVLLISDGEWNIGNDPDQIAHKGHTEDVRPDIAGDQKLNYYSVFIFGSEGRGRNSMRQIALYGGFSDFDVNTWPYGKNDVDLALDSRSAVLPASPCDPASVWDKECREWDEDRDGLPDNYYEASEGDELETALISAISDIVKHASSGTAASVLASGEGSGANLVQAVFYPKRRFADLEISWTSTLLNLWYYLDPRVANSTIREDSDLDRELELAEDYVVRFDFDKAENKTVVNLYDSDSLGEVGDLLYPNVELEDINYLWESGSMLHERDLSADPRTIYTNIDDDSTLDVFDAVAANVSALQPFLNTAVAGDEDEAKWTIDYIRGDDGGRCANDYSVECEDDTPCASVGGTCKLPRNRTVTFNGKSGVWKLGDIIYSTPRIVSWIPLNNYDGAYEDQTYKGFTRSSDTYKNRGKVIEGEAYGTGMVFAGGNDGMLHAFKLGALGITLDLLNPEKKAVLKGSELGREEWAFIPKGALPYLKYLMDTDYCHLYYVDATPTIFDASIGKTGCTKENYWDCDKESTNASWRTVLIGGMRLGGACQDSATASAYGVQTPVDGEGYSSYFALDITDLANPELLWEFSAPGLGFASTGPAIIRINARSETAANLPDKDRNGRWFAIFASGPTGPIDTVEHQFKGYSDQNLKLFVVDVKDGSLVRTIDTGITNAFGGSLFTAAADYDLDYQDDVIYIGYTKSEDAKPTATTQWTEGGVIRLVTGEDRTGTASAWANTALNPDKWAWSHVIENTGSTTSGVTHLTSYSTKKGKTITSGRLFFGTGRYFFKGDDSLSQRRLYGIKEPCLTAVTSSCTKDTSLSSYFCSVCLTDTGLTVDKGTLTDQTTTVVGEDDIKHGWYIDLDGTTAERVITDPVAIPNGAVFFTSFDPKMDICSYGGSTYIWAVDYKTGGSVSLRGKALLQVSTGAIKELDLRETKPGEPDSKPTFSGRGNRRTTAIEGVPPPDQGLLIMVPPPAVDLPIHIQKK